MACNKPWKMTQNVTEKAVELLASGKSEGKTAEELNVSRKTISRLKTDDEIRRLINEKRKEMLEECVPGALELRRRAINTALENPLDNTSEIYNKENPPLDLKERIQLNEIGLREGEKILKSVGIDSAANVAIQNKLVVSDGGKEVLSPFLRSFMVEIGKKLTGYTDIDEAGEE